MLSNELRNNIDNWWQALWPTNHLKPLSVIDVITYLLFLKQLDEAQTIKEWEARLAGEPVKDPIYNENQKELRWSTFKKMDPESMYRVFTKEDGVFHFLKNESHKYGGFGKFINDNLSSLPIRSLLAKAVNMINAIDTEDQATKAEIYDYLLQKVTAEGQNKQFTTPPHIIKLVVEMMEPRPDDVVFDPNAGTGGYLVASAQYLKESRAITHKEETAGPALSSDQLVGMELDPLLLRIGAMNMIMHGIKEPYLKNLNELSPDELPLDRPPTLIMTTLPFTGSITRAALELGALRNVDSNKVSLHYLEMVLKNLKEGGRAAVVVPYSILSENGQGHREKRQEIIDNHKLEAVISMPSGVFRPYTGIKTAILIFRKDPGLVTQGVWFYNMHSDGLSLDGNRVPLIKRGVNSEMQFPEDFGELPVVLEQWREQKEKGPKISDKSFFVSAEEIRKNNYNLDINHIAQIENEPASFNEFEEITEEIKVTPVAPLPLYKRKERVPKESINWKEKLAPVQKSMQTATARIGKSKLLVPLLLVIFLAALSSYFLSSRKDNAILTAKDYPVVAGEADSTTGREKAMAEEGEKEVEAVPVAVAQEEVREENEGYGAAQKRANPAPEVASSTGIKKIQYRVRSKAYFHSEPRADTRQDAFISRNDNGNAAFNALDEKNGFIYVAVSSKEGEMRGWLWKKDLRQVTSIMTEDDVK